jgi:5-carboxymethyl-2-hydroxymuconate isomerase
VTLRIGQGRDAATRKRAAETVFVAVCDVLQPAFDATPLAISLDLQEIEPETSFKKNNLHAYVDARKKAAV